MTKWMQAIWKMRWRCSQPGSTLFRYVAKMAVEYEEWATIHTPLSDCFEYTIRVLSVYFFSPNLNWNALRSKVSTDSMSIGTWHMSSQNKCIFLPTCLQSLFINCAAAKLTGIFSDIMNHKDCEGFSDSLVLPQQGQRLVVGFISAMVEKELGERNLMLHCSDLSVACGLRCRRSPHITQRSEQRIIWEMTLTQSELTAVYWKHLSPAGAAPPWESAYGNNPFLLHVAVQSELQGVKAKAPFPQFLLHLGCGAMNENRKHIGEKNIYFDTSYYFKTLLMLNIT